MAVFRSVRVLAGPENGAGGDRIPGFSREAGKLATSQPSFRVLGAVDSFLNSQQHGQLISGGGRVALRLPHFDGHG